MLYGKKIDAIVEVFDKMKDHLRMHMPQSRIEEFLDSKKGAKEFFGSFQNCLVGDQIIEESDKSDLYQVCDDIKYDIERRNGKKIKGCYIIVKTPKKEYKSDLITGAYSDLYEVVTKADLHILYFPIDGKLTVFQKGVLENSIIELETVLEE